MAGGGCTKLSIQDWGLAWRAAGEGQSEHSSALDGRRGWWVWKGDEYWTAQMRYEYSHEDVGRDPLLPKHDGTRKWPSAKKPQATHIPPKGDPLLHCRCELAATATSTRTRTGARHWTR